MNKRTIFNYFMLTVWLIFCPPVKGDESVVRGASQFPDYETAYNELMSLRPDFSRGAVVQDLTIRRDVATFELKEGKLYLLTTIRGRIIGAIFLGKGAVHVSPPTQIEREQLYRFYETNSLDMKINTLFILFADNTFSELERKVIFQLMPENTDAKNDVEYCLQYLGYKKTKYFYESIMKFILENEKNSFFYAHFSNPNVEPLCFVIDPYIKEEIRLLRRTSNQGYYYKFETVCQFHKMEDYQAGINYANEKKDLIKILQYNIECTIKKNLDFSAVTSIRFAALDTGIDWLVLQMYSDMIVDSAFWDNGEEVNYFKTKRNRSLWIKTDSTLIKRKSRILKLFYHGPILEINDFSWIYFKDPILWYPHYSNNDRAVFDITYHYPKKLTLISVGKLTESKVNKNVITSRWLTPRPVKFASFNLGYYNSYEIDKEGLPHIIIYQNKHGHSQLGKALAFMGVASGRNMLKQVGVDIENSVKFYQYLFGSIDLENLYVTEAPNFHGLAFPGLINLSWITFQVTSNEGYDEIFRGHEVAHQWWGIGVDYKTYHDQWLSEGFATYSGLLYMQQALKGNEQFFSVLNQYRDEIINNRKYIFGSGQEAGPIWLGYRTSSSKTKGDYNLIIYKKGAWVLHMLRNMMIDLRNMNEDPFNNMLHEFYTTYRERKASTEDFQRIVEKYIGGDMSWFFRQWVYGTDVPTYYFSYKTENLQDGRYLVHCKVRQKDVPDDFKTYMIIKVDFGKKRHSYLRVMIKGSNTEFTLPIFPMKPEEIEFNAFESVLCKLKKERWK